jgi:putative tryptophan/tyrosine transport system permease protein
MALGVYLSFRVLDFPDLTVDGSFVTGAAVAATMIVNGFNPFIATVAALFAGFIAGCITGLIHTVGKINALLSGILMMIALYSINIRIMDRSNVSLLNIDTAITHITSFWQSLGIDELLNKPLIALGLQDQLPDTWGIVFIMLIITILIKLLTDVFLKTEIGLAIRATGDNKRMIRSLSANTNLLIILGLGISNAMVALSGALIAQYGSFADVGMGIGMIIIGLASVIIGEALFGTKTIAITTLAVVCGAIVYRIVISLALRVEFLKTSDTKMITASIVILALVTPKIIDSIREKKRKKLKQQERMAMLSAKGGEQDASIKSDL